MAETDVSCLCTEGERGKGLICLLGQVLKGAGADTINLMLHATPCHPPPEPLPLYTQLHRTLGTCNCLIHMENLCQQYAFTPLLLFPVT